MACVAWEKKGEVTKGEVIHIHTERIVDSM